MDIRSRASGYSPNAQLGRTRDAGAAAATRPAAAAPGSAEDSQVDRVELSGAARELSARLANGEPDAALSAERIRQIATRMRSGAYDQANTIDRILEGVRSELTRGDSRG